MTLKMAQRNPRRTVFYLYFLGKNILGFPGDSMVKNMPANAGVPEDLGSIPGSRRFPGGGNGIPLQYSFLDKSHRQRSLVGYSPWDHKQSDTTEQLSMHAHTHRQSCPGSHIHGESHCTLLEPLFH